MPRHGRTSHAPPCLSFLGHLGYFWWKTDIKEGLTMPTYSYQCAACRKRFSKTMTISEHDKARPKCPKCGSRKVQQQIVPFGAVTSKKS